MKKVFLQLADESFVVSEETAAKVQQAIPPDRYVTLTSIRDEPDHPLRGGKQKSSVFDRQQPKLSDKEKEQAARFARHLAKLKQKAK
jgi:hypothetical protein